ncbi:hypothetical protein T4D_6392 [Trichinella pseudospiralis]|uniref:Uncharacterized protein n=1 Tax=Trichinella pseudospiralis TaxID=6337 RepID=A0A0V1FN28_TRIPS|nr:hypothetical protein T4D_6392 [Trichinella pseudospiralis]
MTVLCDVRGILVDRTKELFLFCFRCFTGERGMKKAIYLSTHCGADFEIYKLVCNFRFAHFGLSQFEPVLHALSAVGAFCLLQTSAILFPSCTVLEQLALKL